MDVSTNWVDKWPQLFLDYGPFFIILVLILVVARMLGNNLQDAMKNPADTRTISFCRWMYAGNLVFTALLVIGVSVWWVQKKGVESSKEFVVRIDISDAQPTDVLEPFSDELFYRNRDSKDAAKRKDTFVAVAEKPFQPQQVFEIVHRKGPDAPTGVRFQVPLDAPLLKSRFAAYRLALNPQKGEYELVAVSSPAHPAALSFISSAFAGNAAVIQGQPIAIPPSAVQSPIQSPIQSAIQSPLRAPQMRASEADPATALLAETGSVYRQIDALDGLLAAVQRGSPPNLFQRRKGSDETLLSYLITLSHHEDQQLRYKARAVLQRMDYLSAVAAIAVGESRQPEEVDRRVLASLDPSDWEAVEQHLRKTGAPLPDRNSAPRRGGSPIPSATADGTQYYGVTTWSSLNGEQSKCLANVVFRQNDVTGARPDEALGFVQSRKGFSFTFRTKSEAIVFADAARRCGASTEFLYQGDKKLARFRDD